MRIHNILSKLVMITTIAASCAQPLPGTGGDDTGSGTSDASGSADASSAGTGLFCGNGIVEAGEICDEGESATCDADCTDAVCGDLTLNAAAGEECEGADLAGSTCLSLGYYSGVLSCGAGCSYDTSGCSDQPAAPVLGLSFSPIKRFDFSWSAADGADLYRLRERSMPGAQFQQIGGDVSGDSISLTMPLHFRREASYVLDACNAAGCTSSAMVDVGESLVNAIGYVKASNTGVDDAFGYSVDLSGDGNTLVVGAYYEASSATGIDGDQADDSAYQAGAVYVFVRDELGQWSQQAYVKASNTDSFDLFGLSVAVSSDGDTLAVGAIGEGSMSTGIDGDQSDDSETAVGAVYVFVRDVAEQWSQQAYVKASNAGATDNFGYSVALSSDGDTLAVSTTQEDSGAVGIGGDQADNGTSNSGAVYVFVRDAAELWSQQAYVKASNPGVDDYFGLRIALDDTGDTLAVGAFWEDGSASGIDGVSDDAAVDAGAAYVFVRDPMEQWSQQAYVKASNTGAGDSFGWSVTLSGDGNVLAVAGPGEDGDGIDGDQADDSMFDAGAAYVFRRDGMAQWSQQAYLKASNPGVGDRFGAYWTEISGDGNTLAVGAYHEDSSAAGVDGDRADAARDVGAVYVFVRDELDEWSQRAYVKPSNPDSSDQFGHGIALSHDGNTLAVGADLEDGSAMGIDGDQIDESSSNAGAVYLY